MKSYLPILLSYCCLTAGCGEPASNYKSTVELKAALTNMLYSLDTLQLTGKSDVDYLQMVVILQKCEIEMSRAEVLRGSNSACRLFAGRVLKREEGQENFLEDLLKHPEPPTITDTLSRRLKIPFESLNNRIDSISLTGSYDSDYKTLLSMYYQVAVAVAEQSLTICSSGFVKKVAETERLEQLKLVKELQSIKM